MNAIITRIYTYIEQNNMLADCRKVIVGLSGGADSVCLLYVLRSYIQDKGLDINIKAVHVNHGIRQEAGIDEDFSKKLCERLGVDFVSYKVDVTSLAKKEGLSLEEAGRKERYRLFSEEAQGCRIAVAHHMNDQAETVLMNLSRGSNIGGLGGIRPVRGNIIRPLLCVSRTEVEALLAGWGQDYVVDKTNLDNEYTRNVCRNVILPKLEQSVNLNAVGNICQAASELREAYEFIEECADQMFCQYVVIKDGVATISLVDGTFAKAKRILRQSVIYRGLLSLTGQAKDIYRTHVESVDKLVGLSVGKEAHICYGLVARREYDALTVSLAEEETEVDAFEMTVSCEEISEKGTVICELDKDIFTDDGQLARAKRVIFKLVDKDKDFINKYDSIYAKFYDYDKILGNIAVRFRHDGDRIIVNRQGDSRKLKKELIDRKIPAVMRNHILLITQEAEVLWAVGVRRNESAMVEDDTARVLMVSVEY